jgi:hypothetical protein
MFGVNIHTRRARDRTSADRWLDGSSAPPVGIVLAAAGVLVERRDGRDGELLAWASAAKPAVLRLELREARFSRGGDAAAARC